MKIIINLVLFIFISIFFSGTAFSKMSKKEKLAQEQAKIDSIEVYYLNKGPKRKYTIVSPLSDTSRTEQRSFQYLKEEAYGLGADAVVDFACKDGKKFYFWAAGKVSTASCKARAIKWVQ